MIDYTINDDKTIAGGGGAILAGRGKTIRQLARGGVGAAMCNLKML